MRRGSFRSSRKDEAIPGFSDGQEGNLDTVFAARLRGSGVRPAHFTNSTPCSHRTERGAATHSEGSAIEEERAENDYQNIGRHRKLLTHG